MSRYERLMAFSDTLWEILYAWMSGVCEDADIYDLQGKMDKLGVVIQLYSIDGGLNAREYKTVRGAIRTMERMIDKPDGDVDSVYWFLLKKKKETE